MFIVYVPDQFSLFYKSIFKNLTQSKNPITKQGYEMQESEEIMEMICNASGAVLCWKMETRLQRQAQGTETVGQPKTSMQKVFCLEM